MSTEEGGAAAPLFFRLAAPAFIATAIAVAPLHAVEAAGGDSPQVLGRLLGSACTGCHAGTLRAPQAIAAAPASNAGTLASLAGRDREALRAALAALRSGERPSSVMQQLLRGYSDEELDVIAAYFASVAPNDPGSGGGPHAGR